MNPWYLLSAEYIQSAFPFPSVFSLLALCHRLITAVLFRLFSTYSDSRSSNDVQCYNNVSRLTTVKRGSLLL